MKKTTKKLQRKLNVVKTPVKQLNKAELAQVAGGMYYFSCDSYTTSYRLCRTGWF